MENQSYKILIDGCEEPKNYISDIKDYEFLIKKELLIEKGSKFFPNFVGEIITPHNKYFSLPKNFKREPKEIGLKNIQLIKSVLDEFSKTRSKEGNTLLYNHYFEPTYDDKFESDEYYYKELKKFFLDYIAYEFIYPLNKIKIHSGSPIKGGKLDILKTVQNRKRFGTGMTYEVKDVKNDDDWSIDDIYYSTIIELMTEFGTDGDIRDIKEMKNYLDEEGYEILIDDKGDGTTLDKKIKDTSPEGIINEIHKSTVGVIHYPIRDTLIEYYEKKKLKESLFKIKVFYTKNFNYVWEELTRKALFNNEEFKKNEEGKFKDVETISKWVRTSEIEAFLKEKGGKNPRQQEDNPNMIEWDDSKLEPDIFSSILFEGRNIRFIGDAKYYKKIDSDFVKEMKEYNDAMDNKYPMCIFVCGDITTVYRKKTSGINREKELIIFYLSTEDAIRVAMDRNKGIENDSLIMYVNKLINKYTRRKGQNFLGGFPIDL